MAMPALMPALSAFLKITKARLILAVVFAGFTGMAMSYRALPPAGTIMAVSLVLMLTGMAVSVQNNLLDTAMDSSMERTRERSDALAIFGRKFLWISSTLTVLLCSAYTWFYLSRFAAILLVAAILCYVLWYTLVLKRKDPFGVILGGLPGALPVLIGGYSVSSRYAMDVWLIFLLMMLWQPAHFWALSLKIKDDYARGGVPVLPLVYGNRYTKIFIYIYGVSMIPVSLAMTFFQNYGAIYTSIAVAAGIYYLVETVIAIEKTENYGRAFRVSLVYLFAIFAGILLEIFL